MKKINLLVFSFALLSAVLVFSIATTKAVETTETELLTTNTTSVETATTSAEVTTTSAENEKPLICTREYMPVCGVDAKTYGNKCTAGDVAIAYEGECKTQKPADTINFNGKTLERIPSPDQIKNFRVMKNENGTLYGVRVQNTNQSANASDKARENANANSAVVLNGQTLERIPSPDQIKNFRVMKNEKGTLYGIRIKNTNQNQVKTNEQTKANEQVRTQNRVVGADIKACVTTAIDKKDEALKTRLTNLNNDVSALIDARNACQKQALESEANQAENLKACTTTFEAKFKELNGATKENHKNIWNNYQNEMKACLPAQEVKEGATLLIEDGGSSTLETAISL
ncbi:hypothetical protein JXK06_03410 [Patescibacteria group bacterium]|nr:hypothetical protein [Patescibacteria group bacterium]